MKLIIFVILGVLLTLGAVRYLERSSIFFPMKDLTSDPSLVGLEYEDIYFTTSDGRKLNGWFIPAEGAEYTLILCHGNAGNIGHRLEKLRILHDLDLNVFIFDYRGYGRSEGVPSESGLYKDAEAAYDHVTQKLNVPKGVIILYGESIGSGVVIDLATKEKVGAIITEEAFTSVKDMARMAYPFLPSFIYSTKLDSLSKIKDISYPILIIHSTEDEIVPYDHGQRLYGAAGEPKTFLKLRGGHNTAFLDSRKKYSEGIKNFIENLE